MKTSLTEFQRNFRQAREAAQRGESVIVAADDGTEFVFELRPSERNPFAGMKGVFGAVRLGRGDSSNIRETVRARLRKKKA